MDKRVIEFFECVVIALVVALILSYLRYAIVEFFNPEPPVTPPAAITADQAVRAINSSTNEKKTDSNEEIEIEIVPMRKLSGMSREEILTLRKYAVQNSIFDIKRYNPNPDVYQVESGLPWIGAYEISCNGAEGNSNIGNGASRESVGILNPAMMFYLNINSATFSRRNYCSEIDYLIPHRMTYNPVDNTIRAYINFRDYYAKNKMYHSNYLTDTNARDLGYNYSHMDKLENIRFKHETNLSNSIVDTRGYYHRGYACGLPAGCNNNSPYVPEYEFILTDNTASFNVKLWKTRPLSIHQKADLNYQMIFE